MANLTGQYDVAVEIGVPLLNRIVAAMHANEDTRYPRFPHSMDMVLDDRHRGAVDPVPAGERSGIYARVAVQVSTPTVSLPAAEELPPIGGVLDRGGSSLAAQAPASPWGLGPDTVTDRSDRGFPWPRRYPKVAARVRIRAWIREPTEPTLPEFVDGHFTVTVGLTRVDVPGGGTFLTLERAQSLSVLFEPAAGTDVSPDQRFLIERLVRNVIRADFAPLTFEVALPPEVRHFNYRLQPGAPTPSVAAMFVLQDRPPPSTPAGVAQGFVPGGAEFGVAVGRDYLAALLRGQLLSGLPSSYSFSKWGVSGKANPQWANATFDLEWGRAVLTVPGTGSITYGPDIGGATTDNFSFVARLGFGIAIVDGIPEPVAAGDPELDFSGLAVEVGFVTDRARSRLKESRDQALAAGRAQIRKALDVGRLFGEILRGVVPAPAVGLTSAAIQPEGLVVGGRLTAIAQPPPVAVFRERDGMLDALDSWIPGGTIDRFVWERGILRKPGTGRVEEHRFVTESDPRRIETVYSTLCLRIEGTRTAAGGAIPVTARACTGLVPVFPAWRASTATEGRPLLPLTSVGEGGVARVAGHYDPWASGRTPSQGGTCVLVHFADGDWPAAERVIAEALAARKNDGALIVLAILPAGNDPLGETIVEDVPVIVTLDDEGRWARAYDASAPATLLVGPDGEVAWRNAKPITAAAVARALDKHVERGSRVSRDALRTAVAPSGRIPEFPVDLPGGVELSVRRLRGRDVMLVFWSSRSEPSMRHVRDLARLATSPQEGQALVIAIGDGESADGVRALAGDRLPFPVIPDPDRAIARRYGISSWPTTIVIGGDQRIHGIELGPMGLLVDEERGRSYPTS